MADSEIQALESGSEFSFELSWRSLTRPLKPTPLDCRIPLSLASAGPEYVTAAQAAMDRGEAREWELILPRMVRPSQPKIVRVQPSVLRPAARRLARPVVVLRITARPAALLRRLTALAGAFLLITFVFAAYRLMQPDIPPVAAQPADTGWAVKWAADSSGAARGRQLSLYRPSLAAADYDLTFSGRIERQSLGMAFRAADASNYYAVKLETVQPGNQPAITHFAVVGGVEGPHLQRMLQVTPGEGGLWRVGLEVRGGAFTVRLQDRIAEQWDDTRLPSGGVGFLNEKEERGEAQSIRISFLKGGARR